MEDETQFMENPFLIIHRDAHARGQNMLFMKIAMEVNVPGIAPVM